MKKRGILSLLVISVLMISIISSVSLVSADSLGDIWSRVTGRVVENETEVTNETETEETEAEQCPSIIGWKIENNNCVSDSGCDYDSSIYDYYNTEEECVSQLREEVDEAEEEEEAEEEVEDEPEPTPTACATEIKVTFDKKVYYFGDIAEIVIEVLDSQGNHLPNYVFNNQIYDGIWHTPGSEKTGSDGYFRAQPTVEKEQSKLGKIKFKVYTNEYSNCNSVEDIATLEIRTRERPKPVPCGIGTCIPEEEEEPEEIPEDKIFYKCNGCELGDKCYPMGYRKQGQYCSENYEFISQIIGKCENSFECKSNLCISGECISEGLWSKIMKWFKKLFGGGDEEPEEPGLKMCSKLLIEKNINGYEYFESAHGHKDHQVALYSGDGEQIGIVKCCIAGYLEDGGGEEGTAAVVCPFDDRKDIETSLYWLLNKEEITLGEYKGQKVYKAGNAIVWTHKDFIVASGTDPKTPVPLPEKVINAYLDKYPNDL